MKSLTITLAYRGCSCCPFLSIHNGYACLATDKKIDWPREHRFEQPDFCPLLEGDIVVKQALAGDVFHTLQSE